MTGERMTDDALAVARARLEAARAEVNALCHGKRWRMCIPVQMDDSDVVLSRSLGDIPALLAHADALAVENAKLRDENNDWRALFLHILNTGSWNMLDEGDFDGEFTPNDLLFLMGGIPDDEDADALPPIVASRERG